MTIHEHGQATDRVNWPATREESVPGTSTWTSGLNRPVRRPLSADDSVLAIPGRHPPSPAVVRRLQNFQNIFRRFTIMIDNHILIARGKSY